MARLGFAVLGAGRIGALHAWHLATSVRGAELVALVDPDLPRARQVLTECGRERDSYATDKLEQVLADPRVGAVLIASPTDLHAPHLEAAARAGKPILCEKPVSLDLAAASRALRLVEESAVPMQIAFQRRYDPGFALAHRRLQAGEIGKLEMFRSVTCDPSPAPLSYLQVSGGIFCDMTIHDIDLALFYGGPIEEVTATGAALIVPELKAIGDVDTAVLSLRFASGAIGVLQSWRRAVYGYEIRAELYGSAGKLVIADDPATTVRRYDATGGHHDFPQQFLDRFKEAYREEVQAFVDALSAGRAPSPGPSDALASLTVGLAAMRSLHEHRPVAVSEIGVATR
ncbi:MAG: inositol 2-dehydrogenase [Candidatus Xenobia bacterium]